MSIESRVKRGDDPAGIAKVFGVPIEVVMEYMPKPAKKKAAKKKVVKSKA